MEGRKEAVSQFFQKAVVRVGLILISVIVIFALARSMVVPKSFGEYGRYRGDSIREVAIKEVSFISETDSCSACHQRIFQTKFQGVHEELDCQVCHGPAAKHIKTPIQSSLKIHGTSKLCSACHGKIAGRSSEIIATVEPTHNGGITCTRCHDPHQPWAKLGVSRQ